MLKSKTLHAQLNTCLTWRRHPIHYRYDVRWCTSQSGSCMSVGRRMTSGFNAHLSRAPKWNQGFETNTAGQQIFSERLFLGALVANATDALAQGKG